ncbi:MAG: response regulator [Clostridia bacterium]|nr:response regulator [Clostridia bacterium]
MYKVLIVEDDPMVAQINEQYVSRHKGFAVSGRAADGEEALRFLREKGADLVILDVFLPRLSGLDVLKKLREEGQQVAVIMVTAANDPVTFREAVSLGAVDYLVKPFAYERFRTALDRFETRAAALDGERVLNQSSIDHILGGEPAKAVLPKGIQEQTRGIILQCLAENGDWMTGEEIAEAAGVSAVTVRRYMNHLAQTGDVLSRVNYETGGRPSQLYKLDI